MQDNNNLKKKIDSYYPKLIAQAKIDGNDQRVSYWEAELQREKDKLLLRRKNFRKIEKIKRKHGHFD